MNNRMGAGRTSGESFTARPATTTRSLRTRCGTRPWRTSPVTPWPDAGDPSLVEGLAAQARNLYEGTDFALSAKSVSGGIFQTCSRLRSMEQFFMDMLLDKPFARELLARVEEAVLNLTEALLSAVGPYVQMVETQDDLGTQRAPLISPGALPGDDPALPRPLSALIKKKTEGKAKVFLHSDGSIFDVIPDVIQAGIEVLNPLQPHAAKMDPRGLKAAFGDKLAFHGGLDQQQTIPFGTPEEAADDVRRVIRPWRPGEDTSSLPAITCSPTYLPRTSLPSTVRRQSLACILFGEPGSDSLYGVSYGKTG